MPAVCSWDGIVSLVFFPKRIGQKDTINGMSLALSLQANFPGHTKAAFQSIQHDPALATSGDLQL